MSTERLGEEVGGREKTKRWIQGRAKKNRTEVKHQDAFKHAPHGCGVPAGCLWAWWWHAWHGWHTGWCPRTDPPDTPHWPPAWTKRNQRRSGEWFWFDVTLVQLYGYVLSTHLQSSDGSALETQVGLKVLSNLPHQTLEGQLTNQQLGGLLIPTDLSQSHCTGPETYNQDKDQVEKITVDSPCNLHFCLNMQMSLQLKDGVCGA